MIKPLQNLNRCFQTYQWSMQFDHGFSFRVLSFSWGHTGLSEENIEGSKYLRGRSSVAWCRDYSCRLCSFSKRVRTNPLLHDQTQTIRYLKSISLSVTSLLCTLCHMLHCNPLKVFIYFWKFVLQVLERHKTVVLCPMILQIKQMGFKGRKNIFSYFCLSSFIILFCLFCCFMELLSFLAAFYSYWVFSLIAHRCLVVACVTLS